MTAPRWNAWPVNEPPADFAERVVAEVVRDRRLRRGRRTRRGMLVAAFAAVLVAGGAWGFAKRSARAARPLVPAVAAPSAAHAADGAAHVPTVDPLPTAPPAPAAVPRRKVEAPPPHSLPAASAGVVPDAGRKVIVPRCNCSPNDSICDCF